MGRGVDELIGWKLSQETAKILENSSLLVRQRTQQLIGSTGGMIVREFSVEYKGVVVFEGSANEVEAFAKNLKGMTSAEKTAHLERLLNLKITPQLIDNGKFWACINQAGTTLKWSNQKGLNGILINEKVIQSYLKTLKGSNAIANQWVGEIAEELHKKGELTSINNIIKDVKTNKELGDIDVANANFWIECKESLAKGTLETENKKTSKFLIIEQFEKYTDPKLSNYLNIENKKVVLAVDKLGVELDHFVLEDLRKMNVTIVTNLNQIKNL